MEKYEIRDSAGLLRYTHEIGAVENEGSRRSVTIKRAEYIYSDTASDDQGPKGVANPIIIRESYEITATTLGEAQRRVDGIASLIYDFLAKDHPSLSLEEERDMQHTLMTTCVAYRLINESFTA